MTKVNRDLPDQLEMASKTAVTYTAWLGGEFGGEGIHVCEWLETFAVHLEAITAALLITATPMQNTKA